MRWRLGVDLGTNSLGWAAIRLSDRDEAIGIIAAGSRIFANGRDPKSGASLAVDRRDARAMRRRRDRLHQRQRALMKYLVADGLFPAEPAERKALERLDPFELRARALDEALPLPHLGRAIWHLNQRRGFKSNRKTDKPEDDNGKIKTGVTRLKQQIAEDEREAGAEPDSWTFGKWLHERRKPTEDHPDGESVRTRLRPEPGEDAKGTGYDFYPDRALIEEEFEAIWVAQVAHHPDVLTREVHDRLFEIVFHQRPLKAPQIGTCTFGNGEQRLAKAHPLFQRRRLLEEVNALKIVRAGQVAERLTPEQRDLLVLKLKDRGEVSFETLRKTLRLDEDARFNKESENRTKLKGDEVAAVMGTKTRFGTRWTHLSPEEQWTVVSRLEEVESDEQLAAFRTWIVEISGFTEEQSKAVAGARLPPGYGRFGETVTRGLIDALNHDRDPDGRVVVYNEAVARLGLHHSDFRTGEVLDRLPYYGEVLDRHIMPGTGDAAETDLIKRVGRLTNPTVHIGLNQLRRTVNALIARYGRPAEIAVELARELKLTDEEKKKRNRDSNENRLAAEKRSQKLLGTDEHGNQIGRKVAEDTGANRALLKLWEELNPGNCLDRRCIYTGRQISIDMLFNGEAEVDHILPFRLTLDDSNANKIVCLQGANRLKRKRSPYEAAADFEGRYGEEAAWEHIASRAARLPRNKRWRFEPDAMTQQEGKGDFLARQLVDTQYLSRLAREYLASLYPEKGEGSGNVWVSPGRLTEMVRRKLGLNDLLPDHNFAGGADQPKNRLDHRHHAIDAIVIAIVDRSMLNEIARVSGQEGDEGRERIKIPAPWDGFRDAVAETVRSIVVSHRPDHGTAGHGKPSTAGRLHNDTAYGITRARDGSGNTIVVRRKPLSAIKPSDVLPPQPAAGPDGKPDDATPVYGVRDHDLRETLHEAIGGLDGKPLEQALARFHRHGAVTRHGARTFKLIRRVRVTEPLTVVPIRDREGHVYKGYKGDSNYRYDVWELSDGRWVTRWTDRDGIARSSVVSMFDAHQAAPLPRPHPTARLVLSLHQDDVVAIEPEGGERRLMRVVKFGQNGQITLAAPNEAGDLKRRDAASNDLDPFKYFAPGANGLKKARARKVGIDELGRIRDPGFGIRKRSRPTRPKAAE